MDTTQKATHWSLVINNPTPADDEEIIQARAKGWRVEGQLEIGKEKGTPHYQLMLVTPGGQRWSAIRKHFTRAAKIEPARNKKALEQYVTKEDTRAGELPSQSEFWPSLSKFWILVYKKMLDKNWFSNFTPTEREWFKEAFDDIGYDRRTSGEALKEMAVNLLYKVVDELIAEGYHIEQYLSPPNISNFKRFHFSILTRAEKELSHMDRQDRQDSASDLSENSSIVEHTHVEEIISQEACIPSIPLTPTFHTDLPPPSPICQNHP